MAVQWCGKKPPMTIQVGICCADQSLVLASDTAVRIIERGYSATEKADTVIHHPKVVYGEHDIAVAMAGNGPVGTDAARELAEYLSELGSRSESGRVPDFLGPHLKEWGNLYFRRHYKRRRRDFDYPVCSLLIANPRSEFCRLWKLRVNYQSTEDGSSRHIVNGHEINSAVFWLDYMDSGNALPSSQDMTGVTVMTVLMAGAINAYGIGGIEVHQYQNGAWAQWKLRENESIQRRFSAVQSQIRQLVLTLSNRPVTP